MPNPFRIDGNWYKGNLHTHTTVSDGRLTPQEAIAAYAQGGYDFLALTDHNAVVDYDGLDPQGLTLISGSEINGGTGSLGQQIHVLALGLATVPEVPDESSYAELVAAIAAQCELCFVAHPYWSLVTPTELLAVQGHVGIEVYNTTCQFSIARGHSNFVWDILLAHGQQLWGFAVDDAHRPEEYAQALVMVKSTENSPAAILAALARGHFYASHGPEIYDITIEREEVIVHCSPARQIAVIQPAPGLGRTTDRLQQAPPFEQARLPLPSPELPFRVEIIDSEGRKAWSNPIFPEEMQ